MGEERKEEEDSLGKNEEEKNSFRKKGSLRKIGMGRRRRRKRRRRRGRRVEGGVYWTKGR